jgi:hypothetical protein
VNWGMAMLVHRLVYLHEFRVSFPRTKDGQISTTVVFWCNIVHLKCRIAVMKPLNGLKRYYFVVMTDVLMRFLFLLAFSWLFGLLGLVVI